MSTRPAEITDENVLTVDVGDIAIDRRFSELKFENAKKKLAKVQHWFIEARELNYGELLVSEDIKRIKNLLNQLKDYLDGLLKFDNRISKR